MRKILSLILAVLLIGVVLAGCGPTIPKAGDSQTPDGQSQATENGDVDDDDIDLPFIPDNNTRPSTGSPVADSYTAYIEAKGNMVTKLSDALINNEDTLFVAFSLLGITMVDLSMIPATLFGLDEQSVVFGLGFFNYENVQYSQNGNSYTISYKDSEGKSVDFSGTYDAATDTLITTMTEDGREILYSEYRKTSFGYVGQYYLSGEDGKSLYKVVVNGEDGAIGISEGASKPAALTGGETVDFVTDCDQWYAISGMTVTGLTSDGKALNFEYTPSEE